jgi:hypothetical protein
MHNPLESVERTAKSLRVPMTHTPRDAEYPSVLRYRIGQEIAAAEQRLDNLRELLADLDHVEPPLSAEVNDELQRVLDGAARRLLLEEIASARVPQVHEFATSGEAYDASQCDDTIRDGDVLVVRNERAVAIMLSAWPTATSEDLSGEHFHVAEPTLDWSAVPAIDPSKPSRDYTRSIEIAQPIVDELRA